jgi:C2H2-type zinc finger/Zinc finger, C2H2 type
MSEICTICGASFGSPADLMAHTKTDHKDVDPASDMEMNPEAHIPGLLCGMCGRRFPTAEALARHNLEPHSIGRPTRRGRSSPTT